MNEFLVGNWVSLKSFCQYNTCWWNSSLLCTWHVCCKWNEFLGWVGWHSLMKRWQRHDAWLKVLTQSSIEGKVHIHLARCWERNGLSLSELKQWYVIELDHFVSYVPKHHKSDFVTCLHGAILNHPEKKIHACICFSMYTNFIDLENAHHNFQNLVQPTTCQIFYIHFVCSIQTRKLVYECYVNAFS